VNSTDESGYEPLLVIEPTWRDNEIIWHMQGNIITADQISSLAKELFGDLIKVARGQMSEAEAIANPFQVTTSNENSIITSITPTPQTVNTNPQTAMPTTKSTSGNASPNQITTLSNTAQQSPAVSLAPLESTKIADQLLASLGRDIDRLMESGKKALEADDTATFEQVKILTEKLEVLKKAISTALANTHQSMTK
jgi:mRNA-degrading endonuclease toxin of MazEF toxin-antitoxin module